jgi:HK97 family phage prohead protease
MTTLIGHTAIFGEISQDRRSGDASDSCVCQIRFEPGVFRGSIQRGDVEAWWNHDRSIVLARAAAGSLRLWEDRIGLAFEMKISPQFDPFVELIRNRTVTQMSMSWHMFDYRYDFLADGRTVRTITELKLIEISPVFSPAFGGTHVALDRGRSVEILKRYLELDLGEPTL